MHNDVGRFTGHVLVVFEISHPVRPVFGHGAAGDGPDVSRVESAMPLEPPQFLQADLVRGDRYVWYARTLSQVAIYCRTCQKGPPLLSYLSITMDNIIQTGYVVNG